MLQNVTDILIFATWLAALVFVLGYGRARWQRTPWGRWLMADTLVILVVTTLGVITIVWGPAWTGRDIVRVLVWGPVAGVMWWRNVLRWRDNRSARRDTDEHGN